MYLIKSLERSGEKSMWWNKTMFGYTDNIDEARLFDREEAIAICKNANLFDQVNDVMVDKNDFLKLKVVDAIRAPYQKKAIEEILYPYNNAYSETNPIGHILSDLEDESYFVEGLDYSDIPHIEYEEKKDLVLNIPESQKDIKLSVYRLSSGNYETTAYEIQKPKRERKSSPTR